MISAHDVSPSLTEQERLYGISELASELGITARAIRFYEAKGLLTPPRVNGGRVYTRRERARLKLVLRAKSIGFSLAEVKQFLDLYGDRGEGRPQQIAFVAERSSALIKELEQKQADVAAQGVTVCEYAAGQRAQSVAVDPQISRRGRKKDDSV